MSAWIWNNYYEDTLTEEQRGNIPRKSAYSTKVLVIGSVIFNVNTNQYFWCMEALKWACPVLCVIEVPSAHIAEGDARVFRIDLNAVHVLHITDLREWMVIPHSANRR